MEELGYCESGQGDGEMAVPNYKKPIGEDGEKQRQPDKPGVLSPFPNRQAEQRAEDDARELDFRNGYPVSEKQERNICGEHGGNEKHRKPNVGFLNHDDSQNVIMLISSVSLY